MILIGIFTAFESIFLANVPSHSFPLHTQKGKWLSEASQFVGVVVLFFSLFWLGRCSNEPAKMLFANNKKTNVRFNIHDVCRCQPVTIGLIECLIALEAFPHKILSRLIKCIWSLWKNLLRESKKKKKQATRPNRTAEE